MKQVAVVLMTLFLGACTTTYDVGDVPHPDAYEQQLATYKHVRLDDSFTFAVTQFCTHLGELCYSGDMLQLVVEVRPDSTPIMYVVGYMVDRGERLRGQPIYEIEEVR